MALIRMEPGRGYPGHRHVGDEDVLVVQGSYRDLAGDHPAGSFVHYDAGSSHSPAALGGQRDAACVLLAVAHEGILPLDD